MTQEPAAPLVLGRISGVYGVQGWVKVFSYTEPKENILGYSPWRIRGQSYAVREGRAHGKGLVASLEGIDDRDLAAGLLGAEIAVTRAQLPPLPEGEYYWTDLYGLRVETRGGVELGVVERIFETGANDVLVVRGEREHLLPLVFGHVVLDVDLARRVMRVDWEADFT